MNPLSIAILLVLAWPAGNLKAENAPRIDDLQHGGRAPVFENGQTVCFLGDSITQGALYQTVIEYFYATRYPDREVTFWNCGIAGDTAQSIMSMESYRLSIDVLGHGPAVVAIMLGMNDVNRGLYTPISKDKPEGRMEAREVALHRYRENMRLIFDKVQSSGAELILMTPTIYEENPAVAGDSGEICKGVNGALGTCAEWLRSEAERRKAGLVDFHGLLGAINAREQAADGGVSLLKLGRTSGLDRVHPFMPCHWIMAAIFLKAQGHSSVLSRIEIDANSAAVLTGSRALVEGVKATPDGLSFEVTSEAIPFVVSDNGKSALDVFPILEELGQEILCVKNLLPGHYELRIDNVAVGAFSHAELGSGINLGCNSKTPQYQQSMKVYQLAVKRASYCGKIRNAVAARYAAAKYQKLDPLNNALVGKTILDKIEQAKAKGADFSSSEATLDAVQNQAALEAEYQALGVQMRAAAAPCKRHYILTKSQQ